MLCSASNTEVSKKSPQINYIILFFSINELRILGHGSFGNKYQVDIRRRKNKITRRRRWVGKCSREEKKRKKLKIKIK